MIYQDLKMPQLFLFMNKMIRRIICCHGKSRKEQAAEGCEFVIRLNNIYLSQLVSRANLYVALCLSQGDVKCYVERIPLKGSALAGEVWLDFMGKERELAAGNWMLEEIEVVEAGNIIYRYEICRPVVVEWDGKNSYEWVVDNDWGGIGDGSKKQPYEVCSPRTLDRVRNYVNKEGVYFRQMCDIQLTGALKIRYNKTEHRFIPEPGGYLGDEKGWFPIGSYLDSENDASFQGTYDGGGFKIDGLFINRPDDDIQGLFGIVEGVSKRSPACLKNIHIGNTSVLMGQSYLGGVVGNAGWAVICDCTNFGLINGMKSVGGIAGATLHTEISDCCNFGCVIGIRDWDGIVGRDAGNGKGK